MRPSLKRRIDEIDGRLETLTKVIESFNGPRKSFFESRLLRTRLKKQKVIALTAFTQAQSLMAEMDTLIAENDLFIEIESLRKCKIFKDSEKEIKKEIVEDLEDTIVIERNCRHSTPNPPERVISSSQNNLLQSAASSSTHLDRSPISSHVSYLCSENLKRNDEILREPRKTKENSLKTPSGIRNTAALRTKDAKETSIPHAAKAHKDVLKPQTSNTNNLYVKADKSSKKTKDSGKKSTNDKPASTKEKEPHKRRDGKIGENKKNRPTSQEKGAANKNNAHAGIEQDNVRNIPENKAKESLRKDSKSTHRNKKSLDRQVKTNTNNVNSTQKGINNSEKSSEDSSKTDTKTAKADDTKKTTGSERIANDDGDTVKVNTNLPDACPHPNDMNIFRKYNLPEKSDLYQKSEQYCQNVTNEIVADCIRDCNEFANEPSEDLLSASFTQKVQEIVKSLIFN